MGVHFWSTQANMYQLLVLSLATSALADSAPQYGAPPAYKAPVVKYVEEKLPPSPTPTSTASPTTTATPTSRRPRPRTPGATLLVPSRSPCPTGVSRRPPTRPTTRMDSWPRFPTPGKRSSPQPPLEDILARLSLAMLPLFRPTMSE